MRGLAGCLSLILTLLSYSLGCHAAQPQGASQEQVEPLSAPDAKSSATTFVNGASIQAGTADTKASLSFQGYLPYSNGDFYGHYQLGGEAPLSSKGSTDEVDIGTVSGLTAGASAHAEISGMWWPHQDAEVTDRFTEVCRSQFVKLIPGFNAKDVADAGLDVGCDNSFPDPGQLKKLADDLNGAIRACKDGSSKLPLASCNTLKLRPKASLSQFALQPSRARSLINREIQSLERTAKPLTLLTLGTTANRQKDTHFNKSDLSKLIKDHTTGYGVALTYARIQGNTMLSSGFSYEKTFKPGDGVQVCSPVAGSSSSKCLQGAIGRSKEMFSRIVFSEARILIKTGVFAIAPRLEYDFTISKFAAKLPIYFAPSTDKALTGGVALGYVTHGDGFGVTIFVNKAFSFF